MWKPLRLARAPLAMLNGVSGQVKIAKDHHRSIKNSAVSETVGRGVPPLSYLSTHSSGMACDLIA